ncbi:MAG: hypothetical protein ABWY58_08305 [Aeromicrobium sp.]
MSDHSLPHRSTARRWAARSAVLAASSLGLVAVAQPAMAVAWGSSSSPLTAYHKSASSGQKQGQAYGDFYNQGGSYARNSSYQKDSKPGGDSVYVETNFQFYYVGTAQTTPSWINRKSLETGRTNSGSWKPDYTRTNLYGGAEKARGQIHVCEDQNLAPDDCSVWAYTTFSY